MISIQRPSAFILLLFLIPVAVINGFRLRSLYKSLGLMYVKGHFSDSHGNARIRRVLFLRTALRILACVAGVFAFAGISWGTRAIPVQKSGDAVCFVFDISYSMTAPDGPDGLTRLEAVKSYVYGLLNKMEGVSVSIVLAKGDGVVAVPLTDDRTAIEAMVESLSPHLMTSAGSSIGKGIVAAIQTFPSNTAQSSHIWVFTDGDETDGGLAASLEDAAKFGFPVTLVGFGKTEPVEILAGDGKTPVKTALRSDKMMAAAASASKKTLMPHKRNLQEVSEIRYIDGASEGAAWILLNQLSGKTSSGESYELQVVPRHKLFILLTILFFIASYFASEFSPSGITKKSSIFIIFSLLTLTSCKSGKATVLSGTFSWYQKKYQNATGSFLRAYTDAQASEDQTLSQYSSYNLAATYIMQEAYEAAVNRLEQINPDSDPALKSAAFYNLGVIANQNGEFAAAEEYFKKAILADNSNLNAKINLEFTHQQAESRQSKSAEKEMTAVNQEKNDNSLANAVFTLIQQEEQERWKKLQSNQKQSSEIDY